MSYLSYETIAKLFRDLGTERAIEALQSMGIAEGNFAVEHKTDERYGEAASMLNLNRLDEEDRVRRSLIYLKPTSHFRYALRTRMEPAILHGPIELGPIEHIDFVPSGGIKPPRITLKE